MIASIFQNTWLLRTSLRSIAVAACALALIVTSAHAASVPIDPTSLAGVPLEQVKTRFLSAGYTWSPEHDNRYIIYTAAKAGAPSYWCEFSRIAGRQEQFCESIRVTLLQGAQPISFASLAPTDWKNRPAYLLASATHEGTSYKHAISIELVGKRSDGMRIRQRFTVKKGTPYISCLSSGSKTQFTVTKGWERCLVGDYAVDFLGPKYIRNFTDSDTKDLLNRNYTAPINPSGLIVWRLGDARKSSTFNPETQAAVGVAAELIAAVQSGKWDWVASLFDRDAQANAVEACKIRRKSFALAHVDVSGFDKPNKTGSNWRVGIGMTKTWAISVIVDPERGKIIEISTEDD